MRLDDSPTGRPAGLALSAATGLLMALWLLPATLVRAADPPAVVVENIRIGLDRTLKVGTWTPVWIDLATDRPEGFEGVLAVSAADEDGTPVLSRQPVRVARGQVVTVSAYIRPGSIGGDIHVRLYGADGRPRTPPVRPEDLRGDLRLNVLTAEQRMIVALGQPQGLDEVPAIVEAGQTIGTDPGLVIARPALPDGLPAHWYGLDAAQTVVIDASDPAVREALPARAAVLRAWVRNGGHLVVATATRGQEVAEALGDLLPGQPAGTARLNDLGALETFAGSTSNPIKEADGRPARFLTVARMRVPATGVRVLAGSGDTPLVARGAFGFGRVTWIGLDVSQKPFADWKDRELFWARALDLRSRGAVGDDPAVSNPGAGGGVFYRTGSTDLSSALHSLLDQPPGVTVVPFGWVAFLVFLYILLIGPIDYLFLKKVVGRMEWTWITFPAIVLGVTLVAYIAAYSLKGRTLKVVKVDAVDVDAAGGFLRGRSWITLFSPQNRDYGLTVMPLGLNEAEPPSPPARLPAGFERLVSWSAPPTPRFGGDRNQFSLLARPYAYDPPARLDSVDGVRIPIWSTKSFGARWDGPQTEPLIEAHLVPLGADRLEGEIINLTNRPLERAVLFFGDQVYDQIGTIPPGVSVSVGAGDRTRPISGYLEERARQVVDSEGTVKPAGQLAGPALSARLGDLVRTAMFRDGMGRRTRTPPGAALSDLDLTGQLALERPMLVADIQGPAAALVLDSADLEPSTVQTTVLRVILPLQTEADEPQATDRAPRPEATR